MTGRRGFWGSEWRLEGLLQHHLAVPRRVAVWDIEQRLEGLLAGGDVLEKRSATVDFEMFCPLLLRALRRGKRRGPGGAGSDDPVLKFEMLVRQALHSLSLAQRLYLVRDRLSWMRFCGLGSGDGVLGENTLWDFREALIAAWALDELFARLDEATTGAGYLPMGGGIIEAPLVAAPKRRDTDAEKAEIKAGRVPKAWRGELHKRRQKERDARWTVRFAKAKEREGGQAQPDMALSFFGYKSHISIDRRHGLMRRGKVTDAAAHDGARLREGLIDPNKTASDVWSDTAARSRVHEEYLDKAGRVSRIYHKKPRSRPMPAHRARGNRTKSRIRAKGEHVFAEQKARMGLFIRIIGIKRAAAMITLANMAYNMKRWFWLERISAPA